MSPGTAKLGHPELINLAGKNECFSNPEYVCKYIYMYIQYIHLIHFNSIYSFGILQKPSSKSFGELLLCTLKLVGGYRNDAIVKSGDSRLGTSETPNAYLFMDHSTDSAQDTNLKTPDAVHQVESTGNNKSTWYQLLIENRMN